MDTELERKGSLFLGAYYRHESREAFAVAQRQGAAMRSVIALIRSESGDSLPDGAEDFAIASMEARLTSTLAQGEHLAELANGAIAAQIPNPEPEERIIAALVALGVPQTLIDGVREELPCEGPLKEYKVVHKFYSGYCYGDVASEDVATVVEATSPAQAMKIAKNSPGYYAWVEIWSNEEDSTLLLSSEVKALMAGEDSCY
jgi:hypothetical protein